MSGPVRASRTVRRDQLLGVFSGETQRPGACKAASAPDRLAAVAERKRELAGESSSRLLGARGHGRESGPLYRDRRAPQVLIGPTYGVW